MNQVALIPSYEPGRVLVDLVKELNEKLFNVVIVDDGSGPAYEPVFREAGAYGTVISYAQNRGKGYALKKGLALIERAFPNSVIVTMDSDGQHTVSDATHLCHAAEAAPDTFIIGSRQLCKGDPIRSRIGNGITRLVYRTVTRVPVYDTQTGLRAFASSWIPFLEQVEGDRYEYEMNVLLDLAHDKKPIEEIPIETIYLDKTNSVSHFNTVKDSFRVYKEIFKYVGSGLSSALLDYGLYALLTLVLGSSGSALVASNVLARVVSSLYNFFLNRKVVFQSRDSLWKDALKYFSLVILVLAINSLLLSLLTHVGLNRFVAKVIVEATIAVFSYCMQHFVIFRKEADAPCDEA